MEVMFDTISASEKPGVDDTFFHSGSLPNAAQLRSRAARFSYTSM